MHGSPRNARRASTLAGSADRAENRAIAPGWPGTRSGASRSSSSGSARSTSGAISRRYRPASSPSPAAVSSTDRKSSAAVPSSNGMGERRRRVHPLDAVALERHRAHERRRGRERVDRRADVVDETGQRQLGRAAAAADRLLTLEHADRKPGAGKDDRRAEPIRPRADDGRIRHFAPDATRSGPWRFSLGVLAERRGDRVHPGAQADVVPDVPRPRPLPAPVDAHDLRLRLRLDLEARGQGPKRRTQKAFSFRCPPSVSPSSVTGSCARIRICACATVVPSRSYALNVTQPANMCPCGVMNVNDSSSA